MASEENCTPSPEPFVSTAQSDVTNGTTTTTGSGPLIKREMPERERVATPPKGLAWILLTNLVISVNYSMLMVTGSAYVETLHRSPFFYSLIIAAFPIGRLVLLMPMGLWCDKGQFKYPFAVCNLVSIIGGIMYGLASVAKSPMLALIGRVVGGFGATQPVSAWAARGYPPEKRTKVESMQKSMNLFGVIVGPMFNAIVANINVRIGPEDSPVFILNDQTAAGYLPALLSLILLIGSWLYIEEPPPMEPTPPGETEANPWKVLFSSGAWICLLLAFQTNLQLAAIDTVLAPLDTKFFGWGTVLNSCVFGGIAFLCLFGAAAAIILLNKGLRCTTLIVIGLVFNILVCVPGMWAVRDAPGDSTNMWLFLIMGGFQLVAIMFYTGPTGGVFQQACGKKQGLLGGLYLMFYSGGRPVGSIVGGTLLNGKPLLLVFLIPSSIVSCLVLLMLVYKRLDDTDKKALNGAQKDEDDDLESLARTLSLRGSFSGTDKM